VVGHLQKKLAEQLRCELPIVVLSEQVLQHAEAVRQQQSSEVIVSDEPLQTHAVVLLEEHREQFMVVVLSILQIQQFVML